MRDAADRIGHLLQDFQPFKKTVMKNEKTTYDVVFNDDENSNSKGFAIDPDSAIAYIQANNGSNYSYFSDYKGGTVAVVNNQTGEAVYEESVK